MGLYCNLIRLSDQDVKTCLELHNEEAIYALLQENRGEDSFDIDKAWHGIHFILNKLNSDETSSLKFLLQGGSSLTNRDWKAIYGIAVHDMRIFDSRQVKEIWATLSIVTEKKFKQRYDPDIMIEQKIYPMIWEERKSLLRWILAKYLKVSLNLNYLAFHFSKLRAFTDGAVQRDFGIAIKYHQ